MNFQLFIRNKIDKIKENKSYGILIEVGAGLPVYNELCMYPNTASKIVMYAESPNSWQHNQIKYDHTNLRAISADVCKRFIETNYYNVTQEYNFILTNTIQIANDDKTQTHGWFGLYYSGLIKYYHFTIDVQTTDRKYLTKLIAKIGLDILASENDATQLENGYIDQILDSNLNQLQEDTLTALVNAKLAIHNIHNTTTVFTPDNKVIRFTEYLRTIQNSKLVVFKGSFNPIHNQHLNLVKSATKELNADHAVLIISVYNRNPEKTVDVDSLNKRIKILNELGFIVIVDCFGEYHYSYTSIINNISFKDVNINYIMGTDIIERFLKDENVYRWMVAKEHITKFNSKWNKCNFFYFLRKGMEEPNIHGDLTNVFKLNIEANDISSTQIRHALEINDYESIRDLVGSELTDLYKKYKL